MATSDLPPGDTGVDVGETGGTGSNGMSDGTTGVTDLIGEPTTVEPNETTEDNDSPGG